MGQGHHLADIWKYNLKQLNCFIELARKAEKEKQATELWAMRVAQHADGKTYSNIMKELREPDHGK